MNNVKIFKQYKNSDDMFEISREDAVKYIENDGYYKSGTIEDVINNSGGVLQTLTALYTIVVK